MKRQREWGYVVEDAMETWVDLFVIPIVILVLLPVWVIPYCIVKVVKTWAYG